MPPVSKKVHINVDLGEGYGNFKCGPDEELIPLIDHANIACGFHAGDPLIRPALSSYASNTTSRSERILDYRTSKALVDERSKCHQRS
jgi:hypothetical protein